MRFDVSHRFSAPPERVAAVLRDPAFYAHLELPDLSLPDVVSSGSTRVVLRYEFTGSLDPLARRLLGGARLTWTQEVVLDGATGGTIAFRAEEKPGLLHGDAAFRLDELPGGLTERRLDGELTVGVPAVGGMAERRIVPGIVARLGAEATAVERRLQDRGRDEPAEPAEPADPDEPAGDPRFRG